MVPWYYGGSAPHRSTASVLSSKALSDASFSSGSQEGQPYLRVGESEHNDDISHLELGNFCKIRDTTEPQCSCANWETPSPSVTTNICPHCPYPWGHSAT